MQNTSLGAFTRKETITERMVRRASELWGVENPENVDPVVRLLLDVMAFELADLGGELVRHNGKKLQNLAEMLIPGPWLLPRPSHALMQARSLEPVSILRSIDQFYIPIREKTVAGEEHVTDVFFAPLADVKLVKGKVDLTLHPGILLHHTDSGESQPLPFHVHPRTGHNEIWIGLDLDPRIESLDQLSIFLDLPPWLHVAGKLLEKITWTDHTGQILEASPLLPPETFGESSRYDHNQYSLKYPENAILDDIAAHYRQRLFRLAHPAGDIAIKKTTCPKPLETILGSLEPKYLETPRYWIQAEFPATMGPEILNRSRVDINCFPVINRRRSQIRHRLHSGTSIIPLIPPQGGTLLNIDGVTDDTGTPLRRRTYGPSDPQTGVYSLHNGHLERFDRTTAEEFLDRMLRLVREECNVFAAFGQEILLRQMNDLRKNLQAIHHQLDSLRSSEFRERNYLIVNPPSRVEQVEIGFWSVQRTFHRGLRQGTPLMQYKEISIQPGSARLKTDLIPGKKAPDPEEKIKAFRYGMLTRDRIVSREDIRQFIIHALGDWVSGVDIRNAVAISPDPKQGLVRVIEILVRPAPGSQLRPTDWPVILEGLTESLNQRSIQSASYKIILNQDSEKTNVDRTAQ